MLTTKEIVEGYDDAQGKAVLEGIDFGELAPDGRIKLIAGFWGPLPTGA